MKLNELNADDGAIAPVLGILLMVAIAVILAAIVGTYALGIGSDVTNTPPQTQWTFDTHSSAVEITHKGGDTVDVDEIRVTDGGSTNCDSQGTTTGTWNATEISAGVHCEFHVGSSEGTLRIIWESGGDDTTETLQRFDYDTT